MTTIFRNKEEREKLDFSDSCKTIWFGGKQGARDDLQAILIRYFGSWSFFLFQFHYGLDSEVLEVFSEHENIFFSSGEYLTDFQILLLEIV